MYIYICSRYRCRYLWKSVCLYSGLGFGMRQGSWHAPPGNVGDKVGANVAKVGIVVGARVGGLRSPTLVGTGVGAAQTIK